MSDMSAEERRQFVYDHKACMYGYATKNDGPSMSICYYLMGGDDLLVLTMRDRAKAKAALRTSKASIANMDMKIPPSYLLIYGDVKLETDFESTVDVGLRAFGYEMELMADDPDAERSAEEREKIAELMRLEDRVVLRLGLEFHPFRDRQTDG